MNIREKSFAYKLIEYSMGGNMPSTNIGFILSFIVAFILIPLSHTLYVILYLTKSKSFNDWNDVRNGLFGGTFTTMGVFILGSIVGGTLYSLFFSADHMISETAKMITIYFCGMLSMMILIVVIRFLYSKVSSYRPSRIKYKK